MRILLSTSLHEHLPALAAFHLNWRAALGERMVTMTHLSATTRADMLATLADDLETGGALPSGETLVINPVSIPTRFGTALPMMIHNHRVATRMGIEATHILLASPYLYALQPGLDQVIEQAGAGLPSQRYALHPQWAWHDQVAGDHRLAALARHLGTPLVCGRADGVFLSRDLFDAMLAVMQKFIPIEEIMALNPVFPLEEILFPTILPILLSGTPDAIVPTRARVWEAGDPLTAAGVEAAIASGLHACGKRIPQHASHPIRQAVLAHLPGHGILNACLGTTHV